MLKGRAWTIIVYPESAPENWQVALRQCGISWGCSPLHDSDVYPEGHRLAGQTKKAHYHVALVWPGPTTYKNVVAISEEFLGTKACKKCLDVQKAVNYWDHDEESNKTKYDSNDIILFNLIPEDLSDLRKEEARTYVKAIKQTIIDKQLVNLWDLDEYLETYFGDVEVLDFLRSHSIYFEKMLYAYRKSRSLSWGGARSEPEFSVEDKDKFMDAHNR